MNIARVGDQLQSLSLRRANADLKSTLERLSQELTSGTSADPLSRLGGDVGALAGIERSLRLHEAWNGSRTEAAAFAGAQQQALGRLQGLADPLGPALLEAATSLDGAKLRITLGDVSAAFSATVSTLNGQFAGRGLFSGAAVQTHPLPDEDTIKAALAAAVSGAATAGEVLDAAETFFLDPAGGYATLIYQGSSDPLAPFVLDDTESVSLGLTAEDAELRRTMLHFGLGALAADGLLEGDLTERQALLQVVGTGIMQNSAGIAELSGRVGAAEARIEAAQARGAAAVSALQVARQDLIGADPYETATRLEHTRAQLETVYTLTARLSAMSLAQVLR